MGIIANPEQTSTKPATQLDWALAYLRRGLPIFAVCSPGGPGRCLEGHPTQSAHGPEDVAKTPLVRWKPRQSRLPTEDELRREWDQWPMANIGLATGRLCGMCVIDLDGADARAEAERRGLPVGPVVTTGRVGGTHHYFQWRDDAPSIFAKSNGIDFRGQGGYVLLPPSRHRSGAVYTWRVKISGTELAPLPRWIDNLAAETHTNRNSAAGIVAGEIAEHSRNATLTSLGGSMRRRGFSHRAILAALLIENADRCRPPLEDTEVSRIAASVARYQPFVAMPGVPA